jgi:hypothetical protein
MGTLGEYQEKRNLTDTSLPPEDTKAQIAGILQHFDVLPSQSNRVIFRYIYVCMIGLYLLSDFLFIPLVFLLGTSSIQVGEILLLSGLALFPVVIISAIVWSFNVWRFRTPHMLRDLLEKKRIVLHDGDADASYLRFLEDYRHALASPKRYFLGAILMVFNCIPYAYSTYLFLIRPDPISVKVLFIMENLLGVGEALVISYCLGLVLWAIYISGSSLRKLMRVFKLRIEPFHTDKCGGLKVLGNFYFGLASPILLGSALFIGYTFALFLGKEFGSAELALIVGLVLLFLLLYALPAIILAFILPLWDIHTQMVSEGETDEETYNAHIEALRQEIQALLDTNQVEEARGCAEKKTMLETLHTPYPTWPFRVRSQIFSTLLGVSGSLLVGVVTAALQQYLLPAILPLLFHKP